MFFLPASSRLMWRRFVYNQALGTFTDEDISHELNDLYPPDNCPVCIASAQQDQETVPFLARDSLTYLGHTYHPNDYALINATDGPAQVGRIISFHNKRGSSPTVAIQYLGRIVDLKLNNVETSLPKLIHEVRDSRFPPASYCNDRSTEGALHDKCKAGCR